MHAELPTTQRRRPSWRAAAWLTVGLMTAVVVLSAFLRHDAAGLGCTPWPVCVGAGGSAAGESAERMARLGHRIAASGVLLLALGLTVAGWRARAVRRREFRLSLTLLLLALALAALGVVTPGSRLPVVAMANLMGGFAMLAAAVRLAGRPAAGAARLGLPAWGAALLVVAQAALGAYVSASQSGTACVDLGACWEMAGHAGWRWELLDPTLPHRPAAAVPESGAAAAQFVHRAAALGVVPVLAAFAAWACRRGRWRSGLVLAVLLASQVATGLVIGAGGLPLAWVLLHNLGTAFTLAAIVRMA
jgi:cytochrome c oxidase assembly protein subunit 15